MTKKNVIVDPVPEIRIRVEHYRPSVDGKFDGWDTIYEQTVEELDLQAVIQAVNFSKTMYFDSNDSLHPIKYHTTPNPGAETDD